MPKVWFHCLLEFLLATFCSFVVINFCNFESLSPRAWPPFLVRYFMNMEDVSTSASSSTSQSAPVTVSANQRDDKGRFLEKEVKSKRKSRAKSEKSKSQSSSKPKSQSSSKPQSRLEV